MTYRDLLPGDLVVLVFNFHAPFFDIVISATEREFVILHRGDCDGARLFVFSAPTRFHLMFNSRDELVREGKVVFRGEMIVELS